MLKTVEEAALGFHQSSSDSETGVSYGHISATQQLPAP